MASDCKGTMLTRQDYFMTPVRLMLADVPVRVTRTVYGYLGDWFAWTSIVLLVLLAGMAVYRGSPNRQAVTS